MRKFSGEVGIKCHQSCLVALVFCTKLYIKLAVSLCSFSQFSFPFNFQTADALVLKFGKLPFRCLFSNTLLAMFDIFFRSKVIHRGGLSWEACGASCTHASWSLAPFNRNANYAGDNWKIYYLNGLICFCWYNPQPMWKDHSISGTTILQTTLEDADNTQFLLMVRQIRW